ncbi:hypothetical protein [Tamlana crocina]|uniref:Limiting CO2-inducible protein B/C beta carbonyic anhydrase domain-containing protein n=1 Tax=Tamlana crocina TaxID=393006 RepID=A0ABX1DH85_9FLAO|nr:hypothetical protein [Tamlana crocina]NJX16439.1 hypothetical protein [Tamlana crocina]
MKIKATVKKHYPNAKTGAEITESYLSLLEKEYKSDLKKMLFATSVCSDDVNVSTDFRRVLSRPFTMGGLGGLPYSGFTGMVAFSHHIPDGGDAFIFYGPHIGITDNGELGKMRRIGQSRLTNSCGALMLALERFKQSNEEPTYVPQSVYYDYQQIQLEQSLMPFKHEILHSDNPKKAITDFTYVAIDKQIKQLVKMSINEFTCDRIFLLGGVIINTSEEFNDYVDVRNFDVINTKNTNDFKSVSILETEAFKNL